MNGYTVPAAVIAGLALLGGIITDNVEPVLTFIGAVGAAFYTPTCSRNPRAPRQGPSA